MHQRPRELAIATGLLTALILHFWSGWNDHPIAHVLTFCWVFGCMLACTFAVVRHADTLAERLGEPYGTLLLTLTATAIEVGMIAAVMAQGTNNPTLARDTISATLMIVLNAMVGIALLLGALRHREQFFNIQGAAAYLNLLLPLAVLGLILPNFTTSGLNSTYSRSQEMFIALLSLSLYGIFLLIQTVRHKGYFVDQTENQAYPEHPRTGPIIPKIGFLAVSLLPVALLGEILAGFVDHGIETLGLPVALGGVLVAALVLAPEALAAFRAAHANQLQRAINISLGSALATISLTLPAILFISALSDNNLELGLPPAQMILLALSLTVAIITFSGGRTNVLQGAVHTLLFFCYVFLILVP